MSADDARIHLTACSEAPLCSAYVDMLSRSYKDHVDLFKANELQVYATVERLISANDVKCADAFVSSVIVKHMDSIRDAEQLLRMCLRLCSSVHPESRDQFCKVLVSALSYELQKPKFSKKLAPLFFDLVVAILDLHVIDAPACAYRILYKSEFYPWKDLSGPLTHLVQSCVTYDTLVSTSHFSSLDQLEQILNLIGERAKATVSIFRATHETALKAVLKWLLMVDDQTGQIYGSHVFKMGGYMLSLIDEQQVTVDTCSRLLEILKRRLDDEINSDYRYFLQVRSFVMIRNRIHDISSLEYGHPSGTFS